MGALPSLIASGAPCTPRAEMTRMIAPAEGEQPEPPLTPSFGDGEGGVVESADAEDVCASVEPACVRTSGCGPGTQSLLDGSVILADVAPEPRAAFLRELSGWLPLRAYTLLYRGSRDSMCAAAFHSLCDDKGPTLVLIRCDKGWVFGGYAGASWESSVGGVSIGTKDAFLLSVTGPHTKAPVRFPVKAYRADCALFGHEGYGPYFSWGLDVRAGSLSPTDCFDSSSACYLKDSFDFYEDVLGMGPDSFTGAKRYTPAEVEVFAVSQLKYDAHADEDKH